MPTFKDLVKITRRGKGKRRRSNPISKLLAEQKAKEDIEKEVNHKEKGDEC